MEIIAINEKDTVRVVKYGDMFHLQKTIIKLFASDLWADSNTTKQEWLASKWILDYDLKVSTDYPTIDEIREKQKAEKK